MSKLNQFFNNTNLSSNTTAKVISIVFAIVFWIFVMDKVNPEIIKEFNNVKVEIVGIEQLDNEGLILLNEEEKFVKISVKGRRNDLLSFDENYLVITADIRGYQKGLNTVPIDKRILVDNVNIVDISKSEIKVELDKIVSIPKVVEIDRIGELGSEFEMGDFVQSKAEVIVTGPEAFVNRVLSVRGEVTITGIENDYQTEVSLVPIDYEGNQVVGVELLESTAAYSFEVFKLRTVPVEVKVIGELPEGYVMGNIDLNPATVVIKGKADNVNKIAKIETSVVDLTEKLETFEMDLNLILPDGIDTPYLKNPIKTNVKIEKLETKEFVFNVSEMPIINLNENLNIKITDNNDTVELILKDVRSNLNTITRNDIELILDVSYLLPGEYILPIEILAKKEIRELYLSPETVELKILDIEE
ncbi:MAG: CdaR family protein [Bacillota bacterium]|nr:CdaR family protein [Bacillota bacterium]